MTCTKETVFSLIRDGIQLEQSFKISDSLVATVYVAANFAEGDAKPRVFSVLSQQRFNDFIGCRVVALPFKYGRLAYDRISIGWS